MQCVKRAHGDWKGLQCPREHRRRELDQGHLTDQGSRLVAMPEVAMLAPDAASVAAFGRNLLDPRTRAPSARAGYAQAAAVRADVAAVWG